MGALETNTQLALTSEGSLLCLGHKFFTSAIAGLRFVISKMYTCTKQHDAPHPIYPGHMDPQTAHECSPSG